MHHKEFKFKEGTVIAEVSERISFTPTTGEIVDTGVFTAGLIGGTAWRRRPIAVTKPRSSKPQELHSSEEAFAAAQDLALSLGFTKLSRQQKAAEKAAPKRSGNVRERLAKRK
jgi:hypothetical protein